MSKAGDRMFFLGVGEYTLLWVDDGLPSEYEEYRSSAKFVDEVALGQPDTRECALAVFDGASHRPFMMVVQSYPDRHPPITAGILLIPETDVIFIGVNDRGLAYRLAEPSRLWEEPSFGDFWNWRRKHDVVLMAAELAFRAYDLSGELKWTAYVEPPWNYSLENDEVHLDVMGRTSVFPLREGPES